jgi:thiamine-phosphate pyrophosphorylase
LLGGLHVLADDDPRWPRGPVAQAEAACRGGADVVQLRVKHSSDAQTLEWARGIRALTRQHGAAFVVNDRFDIAIASEADAVHLGQDDMPPDAIPARLREALAIGRSTHTLEEARRSRGEDIDYAAFGPVFGTRSKDSPYDERGLEMLAKVAREVAPRPLIAIGGISLEDVGPVIVAGAAGIAVISAVAGAEDPVDATRALAEQIHQAGAGVQEDGRG